jgi:hypothetical protein
VNDKEIKIRGIQITAGEIIKYVENIMYIRNFREMTIDTTQGSWLITKEDLLDFVKKKCEKENNDFRKHYKS